jgi:hypothetical protein
MSRAFGDVTTSSSAATCWSTSEIRLKYSRLRAALVDGGTLIIALPNVLHWRQRLTFLRGTFRYTPGGIMDARIFASTTGRVRDAALGS